MAHHKSALKRIRQNVSRTAANAARVNRIRSYVKKVEVAVNNGDQAAAREALRQAQPEVMRGVSKGVIKQGTASRKISRLSARVKAMAAASA